MERRKPKESNVVSARVTQLVRDADVYIRTREAFAQRSVPKSKFPKVDWNKRTYTRVNPETGEQEIAPLPQRSINLKNQSRMSDQS